MQLNYRGPEVFILQMRDLLQPGSGINYLHLRRMS
jgi:hypothetical protein